MGKLVEQRCTVGNKERSKGLMPGRFAAAIAQLPKIKLSEQGPAIDAPWRAFQHPTLQQPSALPRSERQDARLVAADVTHDEAMPYCAPYVCIDCKADSKERALNPERGTVAILQPLPASAGYCCARESTVKIEKMSTATLNIFFLK